MGQLLTDFGKTFKISKTSDKVIPGGPPAHAGGGPPGAQVPWKPGGGIPNGGPPNCPGGPAKGGTPGGGPWSSPGGGCIGPFVPAPGGFDPSAFPSSISEIGQLCK